MDDFAGKGDGIILENANDDDNSNGYTAPLDDYIVPDSTQSAATETPAATETAKEAIPFDNVNFEVCPLPDVPMTGQRWDTLEHDLLQQALGIVDPSMLPGHFDAINQILNAGPNNA